MCSVKSDSLWPPWTIDHQAPLSMGFSRQQYWSGCHFLFQGIFWTQGSNLHLLHQQAESLPLHHLGSPRYYLCWCSVAQSCLTLYDPMDCSMPSLPVSHHHPEFAQVHVHASVMMSSHLILWCPLLLLPSIFPSIKDFSNESSVHIRWPKYWSFSLSLSPSSEYSGLISLKIGWLISLLSKRLSGVFSSTTVRRHQFFGVLPSLWSSSHNRMWPLGSP